MTPRSRYCRWNRRRNRDVRAALSPLSHLVEWCAPPRKGQAACRSRLTQRSSTSSKLFLKTGCAFWGRRQPGRCRRSMPTWPPFRPAPSGSCDWDAVLHGFCSWNFRRAVTHPWADDLCNAPYCSTCATSAQYSLSTCCCARRKCSEMSGKVRRILPAGRQYLEFEYDVLRVWETPAERFLESGLVTLSLAPLARNASQDHPGVLAAMRNRLARADDQAELNSLWVSTYVLIWLAYPRDLVANLLKGVRSLRDSDTYQAILDEGRADDEARGEALGQLDEARRIVLRFGHKRFGAPPLEIQTGIGSLTNLNQTEPLAG